MAPPTQKSLEGKVACNRLDQDSWVRPNYPGNSENRKAWLCPCKQSDLVFQEAGYDLDHTVDLMLGRR